MMSIWFRNFKSAFFRVDPKMPDREKLGRALLWFGLGWGIWWTLLPVISLENTYIDILENIVWGSHPQFGYDKNPFFGAWLGYGAFRLTGGSLWINYLISQIFVLSGFWATWKLANRFVAPPEAFLSVIALAAINFYGMKATELCDDVMELGLWPLTVWYFYRALVDGNRLRDWLLTGIFAGISFMTKYYAMVLFLPMFLVTVGTAKGRAAYRSAGIYAAAVLALMISLPNLFWLFEHEFVAVNYALSRAALSSGGGSWINHIYYPWRTISRAFSVVCIPLILLALVFFHRSDTTRPGSDGFHRSFLLLAGWGPFASTLLFSLTTGGSINYSWVLPCFALLPLTFFYFWKPSVNRMQVKLFYTLIVLLSIVFGTIFLVRSVYQQPYLKRKCDYENYPGRALSRIIDERWRKHFNTPLPYVVGDREAACNIAVYSGNRPEAYFSANPAFSQWIDEEDLRRRGGVLLWEGLPGDRPDFLARFDAPEYQITAAETVVVPRATPEWFSRMLGRAPKPYTASFAFLRPQGNTEQGRSR